MLDAHRQALWAVPLQTLDERCDDRAVDALPRPPPPADEPAFQRRLRGNSDGGDSSEPADALGDAAASAAGREAADAAVVAGAAIVETACSMLPAKGMPKCEWFEAGAFCTDASRLRASRACAVLASGSADTGAVTGPGTGTGAGTSDGTRISTARSQHSTGTTCS